MPTLLSARNIYWRISAPRQFEFLIDICLDLKNGDFLIIRGPSGSGKTKLLEILGGNIEPSSGGLVYKSHDLNNLTKEGLDKMKKNLSFISETPVFLSTRSLYKNIEYILKLQLTPNNIIFDKIIHVLKLTGLITRRDANPGELSSTEQKMFSLAMALVRETEILLCDFNLYGTKDEEEIIRLLKNASLRGAGVILTAKDAVEFKTSGIKYLDLLNGRIQ